MKRNLFFVIVSLIVVAGCGRSRSPAQSTASASPPDPAPSAGAGADAGQPVAVASDAGTTPPDCSPDAAIDARCFDPGPPSVAVTESNATQCAAFLPVTVPEPVLFTITFPGAFQGAGITGAIPDGDGHLGIGTAFAPAYPGLRIVSTAVLAAGGKTLVTLPGTVVRSTTYGFLAEVPALDYGEVDTLSAWSGGPIGSLEVARNPYPLSPDPPFCSWAAAPDSSITAACWSSQDGASLRHFDDALVETTAPVPLAEKFWLDRIDEQGRLLTSEATDTLRWRNPDGTVLSAAVAGAFVGRLQPLVGGGFDTASGVLPSGSMEFLPKPQWLEQRARGDLSLVRGRRAYAFTPMPGPTEDCTRRLELLAPDGTVCATVAITEPRCSPGTPADPRPIAVGAEGSVSENARWLCQGGTCLIAYRVWNHLLQ